MCMNTIAGQLPWLSSFSYRRQARFSNFTLPQTAWASLVQRFLSLSMTDETGSTHAGDTTAEIQSRSFRVKLYKLDSEGTWEDQGTGYCIYQTVIYPSTP